MVKRAAGSNTQTELPFTAIVPDGVAVDTNGNVYVADNGNARVVKLAAGSNT
ncbi:MAG: serine/threonine protein kinase, bacterial, partial [Mycobacterium sp.]|nr:serine/threonine protein kinase, bacterial [Mycobacterium sp.]